MALSFLNRPKSDFSIFKPKDESELFKFLIDKGYLVPSLIKTIELEGERSHKDKIEILEENKYVPEDKLTLGYSMVYDIPVMHVPLGPIPPEALTCIPSDLAYRYQIIPISKENGNLKIGSANPFKLSDAKDVFKELFDKNRVSPLFYIIPHSDYKRALVQYTTTAAFPARQTQSYPAIVLSNLNIPFEVINKLPQNIAEKYQIMVFSYEPGKVMKVAMVNPADPKVNEVLGLIEKRINGKLEKYVTNEEDFKRALVFYQPPKETQAPLGQKIEETISENKPKTSSVLIETVGVSLTDEDPTAALKKDISSLSELESIVKSGHVPKVVAALINYACKERATDIHIQPYEKDMLIRYRVDGLLRDIIRIPKDLHPAIISRIKILSKLKIDEQRIPQDGRFDLKFHERSVDIRVSTLPTSNGEKIVLRILDKSFGILTLEQIGLQGRTFKDLVEEIGKPFGVILATGPTGSGKTTTLYAVLNRIKNPTVNIVTLEDPVEYEIEGLNQSQIRPDIGYSFATGLRSILRQDPNIVMVGEIRDGETASLVTHAALTGHLVLTTLHTNGASAALPRLINMGVEPFLITSSINVIVAQRLLRKVCQKCQQPASLTRPVMEEIEKEAAEIPKEVMDGLNIKTPYQIRKGKGCDECNNGYKGRIGIFETLVMNSAVEELAIKKRPSSEIQEAAIKNGMITM
ncbi:MAG: type II/IV secretion system protein, partial [Candidatus Berkelbacteria bacterium]|nr:type II/IV secretion system protein [Candidatus Berkelbacteria bacterium]